MKKVLLLFLMAASSLLAQAQVSNYSFVSSAGIYTSITDQQQLGNTSSDDEVFENLNIGFNFSFANRVYTKFSVGVNGFVVLGETAPSNGSNILSNDDIGAGLIAAFNEDLGPSADGLIQYGVVGTAGSRTLVVQWEGYEHLNSESDVLNFQIRLTEGTNLIEIVYGPTRFSPDLEFYTPGVGLRGQNINDFNIRTTDSAWTASTAGTDIFSDRMARLNNAPPPQGLTYTWTAPAPSQDIAVSSIVLSGGSCSLTGTQPIGVVVKNAGPLAVDSISGSYSINNQAAASQLFVLAAPLAPGDSTTLSFTSPYTFTGGISSIRVIAHAVREASFSIHNDTVTISRGGINQLPFEETFVSTTELPVGWVTNPVADGSHTWTAAGPDIVNGELLANTTTTQLGAGAAFYDSYHYQDDARLTTPCFDFSTYTADSLLLEMSYLVTGAYINSPDSLYVQITRDNGQSYETVAGLARLDTALGTTSARWQQVRLNVRSLLGQSGVRLSFLADSHFGDNLVIDYVRLRPVNLATGTRHTVAPAQVSLYPNPTHGRITLDGLPAALVGTQAAVSDMSGRLIQTRTLAAEMNLGDLPAGFYYLTAPGLRLKVALAK